jgi:hypothetical protein
VISESRIGKDFEGSSRDPILRYYPGIHPQGLRKTTINISHDILCPGRDLKPRRPEYEAEVNNIWLLLYYFRCSVILGGQCASSVR